MPQIKQVSGGTPASASDRTSEYGSSPVLHGTLADGLLINVTQEKVLRFLPPFLIQEKHVDAGMRILKRQLAVIRPKVVCCLGTFAAQTVLQMTVPISRLRGQFFDMDGMRVIATFHPAYLLRSPDKKREVWEDMKQIRAELSRLRS